jgi:hypothetical protein
MAEEQGQQDGSRPERGTGQRQDHRAAPPGHRVPGEAPNLADPEEPGEAEDGPEDEGRERAAGGDAD